MCLTVRQAAKISDSLRVLPKVRREADTLRVSMVEYRHAADSAKAAAHYHWRAFQDKSIAYEAQTALRAAAQLDAGAWRRKARRRGLLNWLAATVVGGAGYFYFFK